MTLVSVPQLQHVAEVRAHTDEVRAVAFTPAGELVTGSWDKRLLVFSVKPSQLPPREVRTRVTKKNGLVLFRAVIDRAASATVALDTRVPMLVVKAALAQAAGIDVLQLTDSVHGADRVRQPAGEGGEGQGAVDQEPHLRARWTSRCATPACRRRPRPCSAGPLLQQFATAFDESTSEIVFTVERGRAAGEPHLADGAGARA